MVTSKGSGESTKSKEENEESSGKSIEKQNIDKDSFTSVFSDQ